MVSTARELQAAMESGARDILIQEHLDLTDLPMAYNSNSSMLTSALGEFKRSTRTIRVRSIAPVRLTLAHSPVQVHTPGELSVLVA